MFVAGDLLFAVLVAAALPHGGWMPPSAALAIGAAALLTLPALFVLGSFIRAAAGGADGHGRPAQPGRLLTALVTEWFDFDRAVFDMITAPWLDRRDTDAGSGGRRPVLLVHGILCNRGVWRSWFGLLGAAGFGPVRAIDLEPLLGDLETHAQTVANALQSLQRECDGSRVSIIAHSMGGLVARAALRRAGPGVIREIVTIASPHHGTALACSWPSPPLRQMRPHSPWLRGLAADEAPPTVPITSIYTAQDNLIVPARSAVIDGGRTLELDGVGHMGLLFRRRCIDAAIAALAAPAGG
jgi:pimeloyl-ACP methyl ester carboxylesterase